MNTLRPTEGTVVWAHTQTAGRGQMGSQWIDSPGEGLALSIILYPKFLAIANQFNLSICIALGVHEFLQELQLPDLHIKWPNDLYVGNRKIGGILIENSIMREHLMHSVVGIGLNINQEVFPDTLKKATSLRIETGQAHDMRSLLPLLFAKIEIRYRQLMAGQHELMRADYLRVLYQYQERHLYQRTSNQETFEGQILGIDAIGQLVVEHDNKLESFGIKEIAFI
jgi:BirA family biotin operon repressor/biotin-[acetyl-CoA-carboxylase] ligase